MTDSLSAADLVKLFAMTNQMIENELDQVERKYRIDLGRARPDDADKDDRYYPQFDEAVRTEAAQMSQHYEIFYCLEKSIRSQITDALVADKGLQWWNSGRIPQVIHQEVAKRMQRDIDSGTTVRSDAPIDFTNFGELSDIIIANWDIFGSIFNSKRAVQKVMANLNTLRGPIAHCSPLAEAEVLRLQLSVGDWFRLME